MSRCHRPARYCPIAMGFLVVLSVLAIEPSFAAAAKNKAKASASTAAVTITAPANAATVSGTVNITAQTGTGVSWINVYIDGAYLASSPPDTFSWDFTALVNGSHTISSNAYTSTGSLAGSASITVNVQNANAKPAVTLTSPANSSTVSGNVTVTARSCPRSRGSISKSMARTSPRRRLSPSRGSPPAFQTGSTRSRRSRIAAAMSKSAHLPCRLPSPIKLATIMDQLPCVRRQIGSTSASTDHVTINAPAGVSPGDVLIAQVATRGGAGSPVTGPPGWVLAAHNNLTSNIVQAVFYHVVPASPAEPGSYTFTWLGTANDGAGGIADYVGVDSLNPIDDVNGATTASSTTIATPALSIPATHTTDRLVAMYTAPRSSS